MLEYLLEPFSYEYMQKAMWISTAVGGICAFLSAYLMLKGWSLIGDALSHSVVPGVAIAYAFSQMCIRDRPLCDEINKQKNTKKTDSTLQINRPCH